MESKTAEGYLKQWHIQDITIVLLDNKRESFGRIRKVPKEVKLSELLSDYSRNTEQQLAEKDKEIERLIERNNFLEVQASTPDKIQIHVLEAIIKIQDREIDSLKKIISDIPDLLHDSLGETVALNSYSISPLATKVSEFYITHNEVGSGEPLKQWIKSEIDKSLSK